MTLVSIVNLFSVEFDFVSYYGQKRGAARKNLGQHLVTPQRLYHIKYVEKKCRKTEVRERERKQSQASGRLQ